MWKEVVTTWFKIPCWNSSERTKVNNKKTQNRSSCLFQGRSAIAAMKHLKTWRQSTGCPEIWTGYLRHVSSSAWFRQRVFYISFHTDVDQKAEHPDLWAGDILLQTLPTRTSFSVAKILLRRWQILKRDNLSTRWKKSSPAPLCPPTIQHELAWDRTRDPARGQPTD
jgi:hypothetical protein